MRRRSSGLPASAVAIIGLALPLLAGCEQKVFLTPPLPPDLADLPPSRIEYELQEPVAIVTPESLDDANAQITENLDGTFTLRVDADSPLAAYRSYSDIVPRAVSIDLEDVLLLEYGYTDTSGVRRAALYGVFRVISLLNPVEAVRNIVMRREEGSRLARIVSPFRFNSTDPEHQIADKVVRFDLRTTPGGVTFTPIGPDDTDDDNDQTEEDGDHIDHWKERESYETLALDLGVIAEIAIRNIVLYIYLNEDSAETEILLDFDFEASLDVDIALSASIGGKLKLFIPKIWVGPVSIQLEPYVFLQAEGKGSIGLSLGTVRDHVRYHAVRNGGELEMVEESLDPFEFRPELSVMPSENLSAAVSVGLGFDVSVGVLDSLGLYADIRGGLKASVSAETTPRATDVGLSLDGFMRAGAGVYASVFGFDKLTVRRGVSSGTTFPFYPFSAPLLTVEAIDSDTMSLTWAHNEGEERAMTYQIEHTPDGGRYSTLASSVDGNSFAHHGIAADSLHYYRVRGVTDSGLKTRWSSEQSARFAVETSVYQVGHTGPAGGIVFYDKGSYSNGWRYIEMAPQSQGWIVWGGSGAQIGNTATAIGTGESNTAAIVARLGAGIYAARVCYDLVLGGHDDWFLPSKDELNEMYRHSDLLGIAGVYSAWSSSESDATLAWNQRFNRESQYLHYKSDGREVRAVRAF